MAVVVSKNPKRYQSIGEVSTPEDREKADRLDQIVKERIALLIKCLDEEKLMPKKFGKGSVLTYWNVGKSIHDIADNPLFNMVELPLLWKNIKLYLPPELLYKDRGPYREHLWYCYRLADYPISLVKKMHWGEWVTIFDSTGINQERRFDKWFVNKLENQEKIIYREQVRIFAPCINALLGEIDISELKSAELFNCYEAAWNIMLLYIDKKKSLKNVKFGRKEVQDTIKTHLGKLDSVMSGHTAPRDYAAIIIQLACNI